MKPKCICRCGRRSVQNHHAVYRQHIRQYGGSQKDKRNLVPVAADCHYAHHSGAIRLRLWCLPDSVFEYAVELMGEDRAALYLARYYAGNDPRLDALAPQDHSLRHYD